MLETFRQIEPKDIFISGHNGLRQAAIACVLETDPSKISVVPVDNEPSGSPLEVAVCKIKYFGEKICAWPQNEPITIIAIDTLACVDDNFLAKPVDDQQIQANLSALAKNNGLYQITSASLLKQGGYISSKNNGELSWQIELTEAGLQSLNTKPGFQEYKQIAEQFLERPLTQLAGGFCLEAFLIMDYVKTVNGKNIRELDESYFKAWAETLIYAVAVGISTEILELLDPAARAKINSWEWLNQQAEKVWQMRQEYL